MTAPFRFGDDDKRRRRQATVDTLRQVRRDLPPPRTSIVTRPSVADLLVGPVVLDEPQSALDINPFRPFEDPSAPPERRGYLTERTLPPRRPAQEAHDDIYDQLREEQEAPQRRAVAAADAVATTFNVDPGTRETLRETATQFVGGMGQMVGDFAMLPVTMSYLASKVPRGSLLDAYLLPASALTRALGEGRTQRLMDLPENIVDELIGEPATPTARTARQVGQVADLLLGAPEAYRRGVGALRRVTQRSPRRGLPSLHEMPPALLAEEAVPWESAPYLTGQDLSRTDMITDVYGKDMGRRVKPYLSQQQFDDAEEALRKMREGELMSDADQKALDHVEDVIRNNVYTDKSELGKTIKQRVDELSDSDAIGRFDELDGKALQDPSSLTPEEWTELAHLDERLKGPTELPFLDVEPLPGDELDIVPGEPTLPGDVSGISTSGDIPGISADDVFDDLPFPKMPSGEHLPRSGIDNLDQVEAPEPGTVFSYSSEESMQRAAEFYQRQPSVVDIRQGGDLPRGRLLASIPEAFDAPLGEAVGRTASDRARQLLRQIDLSVGEQSVIAETAARKQGITFDFPGGGPAAGEYAQRITEASRPTILQALIGGSKVQFEDLLREYGVELPRGFDLDSFRRTLNDEQLAQITRDYLALYGFKPGSQQSERFLRGMEQGLVPDAPGYGRARKALYNAVFRRPPE